MNHFKINLNLVAMQREARINDFYEFLATFTPIQLKTHFILFFSPFFAFIHYHLLIFLFLSISIQIPNLIKECR